MVGTSFLLDGFLTTQVPQRLTIDNLRPMLPILVKGPRFRCADYCDEVVYYSIFLVYSIVMQALNHCDDNVVGDR